MTGNYKPSDTVNVIDWTGAKRMPLDEFVKLEWPENKALSNPDSMVDGIVCYLNEDGRSRDWGDRHFVLFGPGPGCAALTAEALLTRLHRGAGAIAYCEKEVETKPERPTK